MTTARLVRRGLRGTAHPHRTARSAAVSVVEVAPSPDGDLRGAACQGVDPELFYAEPDPDDTRTDLTAVEFATRRAKAICGTCPVREACLALALRRNEPHGVFGGLTADERRAIKRTAAGTGRKAGAA